MGDWDTVVRLAYLKIEKGRMSVNVLVTLEEGVVEKCQRTEMFLLSEVL